MVVTYEQKRARLADQMKEATGRVALGKNTTNLFRGRPKTETPLDVRNFNKVIAVNAENGWVDAEGAVTYETLVDACLAYGVLPAVVPELKSITPGGAVSGTGLESSSFRHGFVHETVLEMDILLADGAVVTCSPWNEYRELFFGFPNSYGTLGYALRLRLKIIPVKNFVQLEHTKYSDPEIFFAKLKELCGCLDIDFLEGVIFSETEHVISVGKMIGSAPYTSDYTYLDIYYRSLLKRSIDYLSINNYIWRWDTDWFWCSSLLGAENPVVRHMLGRKRLNSVFYMRVRQWVKRIHLLEIRNAVFSQKVEEIIQDVEIPIENATSFLNFFHTTIGFRPIIVGPVIGSSTGQTRFPFFPLHPKQLYVNIGFWSGKITTRQPGYYNRLIEDKIKQLDGYKMLYSDSFYDEPTFWSIYGDKARYQSLKAKYDPNNKLDDLFHKCVSYKGKRL